MRRALWPLPGMGLEDWDKRPHQVFPLDFEEGEWLLRGRLESRVVGLVSRCDTQGIDWGALPTDLRVALGNMAYQLGSAGVFRFRRMMLALKDGDYQEAAREALDSKWAKTDSPARAKRVAALIRGAK